MNIREIKIKFLKTTTAQRAVWTTHCECCGPELDGWMDIDFYEGEEVDPDERYNQIDLRKLVFGTDYAIIHFVADNPDLC